MTKKPKESNTMSCCTINNGNWHMCSVWSSFQFVFQPKTATLLSAYVCLDAYANALNTRHIHSHTHLYTKNNKKALTVDDTHSIRICRHSILLYVVCVQFWKYLNYIRNSLIHRNLTKERKKEVSAFFFLVKITSQQ